MMDNLLPMSKLSPEARELMATVILSKEEVLAVAEGIAKHITPEKGAELAVIIAENAEGFRGFSEPERIAWLVRQSYKFGAIRAIELYTEAMENEIRGGDNE